MNISDRDKEFLIHYLIGSEDLIEADEVGDLLLLINDAIIDDEIENEDLSQFGSKLQAIYDRIDENNPE